MKSAVECQIASDAVRPLNWSKRGLIPVLLLIACLIAGTYGALHNQISYTVSPEYFTRFKFYQMQIPSILPERIGASVVGVLAAWWMGIVINVVVIPVAMMMPDARSFFRATIRAYLVVTGTTVIVGFVALAAACVTLTSNRVADIQVYGNEITDDVAFARAGTMHNFSYLGGLIGIATGCYSVVRQRRRLQSSPAMDANSKRQAPENEMRSA